MINSLALSILLLAFFASITFNGFFRAIAKKNNFLIDIPDKSRKFHFRATPLTGGIGIFFGILVSGILMTGLTGAPVRPVISIPETSIPKNIPMPPVKGVALK